MRILQSSLALRLILPLTFFIAIVSGVYGFVDAHIQEKQLIDEMVLGVDQLSRGITSATWHAMLYDQRETAYTMMRTIGEKQGIESIRFFNKEGLVTFSTDPNAAKRVDKNAEACFLCHTREQPLVRVDMPSRARVYRGTDGSRKVAMVTPIYNEPSCSEANCHAHPGEQSVLGVLDITMNASQVDRDVAGIQMRTFFMTVIQILLIVVLVYIVLRRYVTRPIRGLIKWTKSVGSMEPASPIDVKTRGELAELASSFNSMGDRLNDAHAEINNFTKHLEQKVEERTQQLYQTQQRLIQSDRLASLGQLAASVAHEINNPIAGVLNFSELMNRLIGDGGIPAGREKDFKRYLTMISEETARVGRIVTDLLTFSRRPSPQRAKIDLCGVIEHTVSLIMHKLELESIQLVLDLNGSLPEVLCDGSQIRQVLINLVMNASESISGEGTITVRTALAPDNNGVIIEVADTGSGIPEEILSRIYDPFFSTKEEGKGVGLGLAVVYGIVDAHDGNITVKSSADTGTTFKVFLPIEAAGSATGNGIDP